MRVNFRLGDLVKDLEWSDEQLAQRLGITSKSARKLRTDGKWRLSREALCNLLLLAFEYDFEQNLFEIRHHALWDTFQGAQAKLFRSNFLLDSKVEGEMRKFFGPMNCTAATQIAPAGEPVRVEEIAASMRQTNCVFIGSPKANPATEIAIALLYGAEPFSSTKSNRALMPFQHMGKSDLHKSGGSAILAWSSQCAMVVAAGGDSNRFRVDWYDKERYWSHQTWSGTDAAVVLVCRKPFGTTANVTTIIVCGYTGIATERAVHDLAYGEPPIQSADLNREGAPVTLVYTVEFTKRRHSGRRRNVELRDVVPKSGRWRRPGRTC